MATTFVDATSVPSTSLYRTVWRWHFYASLFVMPLVIVLSITGIIYLFGKQIDGFLYSDLFRTPAVVTTQLPPTEIVAAAQASVPGSTVTAYEPPVDPGASARVELSTPAGDRSVFVDPSNAAILGSMDPFWQLSELAVDIHGTLLIGTWGDRIVEIAACWCFVMLVTGVYLWWPRGVRFTVRGTLLPRLGGSGKVFWRDLHSVTGAWTALIVGFLILTGLPWAGYWGDKLYTAAGWFGQSYPAALWDDVPVSTKLAKEVLEEPGWTLQGAPMPASTPDPSTLPPTLDDIVKLALSRGMPAGYTVNFPEGETGVWTASVWTDQRWDSLTLHIDRYSGKILAEIPFSEIGLVAKGVEYGIVLHEGRFFGLANQLIMLAGALALIVLPVTGFVLWWRRRPEGVGLGAPPMPSDRRVLRGMLAIILFFALFFPLLGLTLIVVVALDQLVIKRVPVVARAFG